MERVISVSLGELVLKGANRGYFEGKLINQMKLAMDDVGYKSIYKDQGKIYIEAEYKKFPKLINRLKKVFGLVYISPCIRVGKDINKIEKACEIIIGEKVSSIDKASFKVETNRSDKQFKYKSPEISRKMGASILREYGDQLKVDVHNPDIYVYVDIKKNAYIYTDKIEGYRGMPAGTSGKGLLLLSGGIDSPVAGFNMARRGVKVDCIHYHSYPFTSERAEEKVKKLAKILTRYLGPIKFYSINILNVQKAIKENCPPSEMTILSRRFMMRIAEKIAKQNGYQALITGESLGQVASQTIESLGVINEVASLPILRPLIGLDKVDIMEIARDIETYEISIIPFVDSCTVFLPDNPVIKPKLEDIEKSEEKLDVETLVGDAVANVQVYNI